MINKIIKNWHFISPKVAAEVYFPVIKPQAITSGYLDSIIDPVSGSFFIERMMKLGFPCVGL